MYFSSKSPCEVSKYNHLDIPEVLTFSLQARYGPWCYEIQPVGLSMGPWRATQAQSWHTGFDPAPLHSFDPQGEKVEYYSAIQMKDENTERLNYLSKDILVLVGVEN